MIKGKRILGLVTARGGSKGLPGKNLLKLGGYTLVQRAVLSGIQSRYIDDVVISTDDEAIADSARRCGCEVPFIRPAELASDDAKSIDVILHALSQLKEREYDIFVLLQPTTPFRTSVHVDKCIETMIEKGADSVVSVTEAEHHPLWMNSLPDDMCMKDFIRPEAENRNRQELPKYYRINGGVYAISVPFILQSKKLFSDRTYAYEMDRESSVDIDSELDYLTAEAYMERKEPS